MLLDSKNGTAQTSLGDVFCGSNRVSLWQDGSVRECRTGEVMLETIYGKKVQIPKCGYLAFRKDGSVCGYTTELETEYTVGKRTYTANKVGELTRKVFDTFNTIWFDENNEIVRMSFQNRYVVSAFYPSGAVWKWEHGGDEYGRDTAWFSEDGKQRARIDTVGKLELGSPPRREGDAYEYKIVNAKLPANDCIRNVYLDKNGLPESYDCYKTVQNLSLMWTSNHPAASISDFYSDDKLEEYGVPCGNLPLRQGLYYDYLLEVDDDGNFIPDETRHPITIEAQKQW